MKSFFLSITPHLGQALRLIRDPQQRLHIWVDAVCINQNDTKEEGTQIVLMRRIYQRSRRTIVYLGEELQHYNDLPRLIGSIDKGIRLPEGQTKLSAFTPEYDAVFGQIPDVEDVWKELDEKFSASSPTASPYTAALRIPSVQSIDEARWRVLHGDCSNYTSAEMDDCLENHQLRRRVYEVGSKIKPTDLEAQKLLRAIRRDPAKKDAWVAGLYKTRRLCVTSSGCVGQAPRVAHVEDIICIFLGSCVPHVLRKKEDCSFRLVGDAYVHGIMSGEAMMNVAAESIETSSCLDIALPITTSGGAWNTSGAKTHELELGRKLQ